MYILSPMHDKGFISQILGRQSAVRDIVAHCGTLRQIFWEEDYLRVVPFLQRLVRGLASQRLNPTLVNLRFVVDKVALGWVFLGVLQFNARQCHSNIAAYLPFMYDRAL
jgi:hypothetical protein